MTLDSFEIRTCLSCGLRYPLTSPNSLGKRCPNCLGETQLALRTGGHLATDLQRHAPPPVRPGRLAVLLDNVRSAWNVGSIFRSADGFGFAHAYLCGITPTPENESVMKTSLGAQDTVTWSYHKDAVKLVQGLKQQGWKVWAFEEHERAIPISAKANSNSPRPVLLIMGNEVTGVDPGLLDLADEILYIPMYGDKTSFNVAIAFGIAAYQLTGSAA